MSTVSTHVLDAVAGRPAPGVPVTLAVRTADGSWRSVEAGVTDADGRLRFTAQTPPGDARLTFGTGEWFAAHGISAFYPEVVITFATSASASAVDGGPGHLHVPLLLSPYAYSTYRGS